LSNRDYSQSHHPDLVAEYFVKRGVSENVQRKGLRGIIAEWEAIAHGAAHYSLTLDDWLNDVDLRDIIAGALVVAPDHMRRDLQPVLARADDVFRAATVDAGQPLSGVFTDGADQPNPIRQWWYFRRPVNPGETMRHDLIAVGITPT
jgi:hypothetical protein